MPPPGGTRTPLNVTYGWGTPGAISGAQDITQFQDQFQPNAGIFSPSYPLVPVDNERARLWDYPTGYNYIYKPRSYEPISFEELRALANGHDITRLAIETRKDQLEKLDWEIRPRDEKDEAADSDKRIKLLTEFWRHPDGERPFGSWLRKSLEDLMVLDAPAFEILRNRDGSIRGYDVLAGDTIKLLVDITGRTPQAPAPAYQQVIHGRPWRLFTTEELLYKPRNVRPNKIYGYSPVEQILMTINIGLRRQLMQLEHFTEGNVPVGILGMPDLSEQQVARAQQYWDDKLAGNTGNRTRLEMVPWAAKWQAFKEPPLKDEFDEWLARVVMFCFSLPPDAFIRQRSRAAAQTAQEQAKEEGLAPLMGWVKRLVDGEIQRRMGHPDLEFAWQEIRETDPKVQADVLTMYVKTGVYTINEARDIVGLDEIEGGDQAMIELATGPVLLKDVEKLSDNAANPPEPPPMSAGGPGALRPSGQSGSGGPGNAPNKPASASKASEAAKVASATFRAPGVSYESSARAQRREDAGRRAALTTEAEGLLRRAS